VTEAEWLSLDRVNTPHMDWLRRRGSRRQFFLAAAAWARQVEDRMTGSRFRDLLPAVEAYADGSLTADELTRQVRRVEDTYYERTGELQRLGLNPTSAVRQLAADVVALQAADPRDAWIAAINALKAAGGVGKKGLRSQQVAVLHDIFGNPFRPVTFESVWRPSTAVGLAESMYSTRDFAAMPILADALEEAGCDNSDVLAHCRGPGPHVRGCWVVDLVLGTA
jgi:hypothetical protein